MSCCLFTPLRLVAAVLGCGAAVASAQLNWPVAIPVQNGSALLYQPQVESYDGSLLKARAAVSITGPGSDLPAFGAIWFNARVATDRAANTATLCNIQVTDSKFAEQDSAQATPVLEAIRSQGGTWRPVLSLNALLAAVDASQQQALEAKDLNPQPPAIIFASQPTVLVSMDGDPRLVKVQESSLLRVVNTPFFIVLDPAAKLYYLKGGSFWYSSPAATGPFSPVTSTSIPAAIQQASQGEQDNASSGASSGQTAPPAGIPPVIQVATAPTELIVFDGPEQFGPIENTNLLYVTNTTSDVFIDITNQQLYVLLSGRWYTAANQQGPWSYVAPGALPPDFANIPAGSPKADVLASVPGTPANADSRKSYYVPQTAALKRTARIATVQYDGLPEFKVVEKTKVEFAVNTGYDVLKVGGKYYCCHEGAWYVADTAVGPFLITELVPPDVYLIPPTYPVYRVTYVRPFFATNDLIWYGYYPGYVGSYLYGGSVVWGTGWAYQPWFGAWYVPRPVTWGFGAAYNPITGNWGFSFGVAGPNGWFDVGRSSWGGWAGGGSWWWGPGAWHGWNHITVNNIYYHQTNRIAINVQNDRFVQHDTKVVKNNNKVLTDKEGRVYRRNLNGYDRYDNHEWKHSDDAATRRDLDRELHHRSVTEVRNDRFRAEHESGDRHRR